MFTRASDTALAVLSGLLLALSFPKFGHPAVAWFALLPLLLALGRGTLRQAFTLGLLTGAVYFGGTLYWITQVMSTYGGISTAVAVPINIALVAYLAIFPGLFALVTRRLTMAYGSRALAAAPLAWVATELGRGYLFTGFPWVLLGYSQTGVLPIAQIASVVGVFGVSMLVAATSAALAMSVSRWRTTGRVRATPVLVMLALVTGIAAWGSRRVAEGALTQAGQPVRVGLVQGNIDQAEKWDTRRSMTIFNEYLRMTRDAAGRGAQFILWPESSAPFFLEEDLAGAQRIRAIARASQVSILVGSDQIQHGQKPDYYNAAFMLRPDGTTGGVYRKIHLVPFGEYVPMKHVLFFAAPLVEAVSDFSAGQEATLLPLSGHAVSTSICYEIVYPDLVRRFVTGGSELLTTITNDAWFGSSSAPYQHFEMASMRAIENGRYLVRSANTGISGIVDPYGRVLARSNLFEPAVIVGEARLLDGSTPYSRHGDVLAYAAVAAAAALVALSRRVKCSHADR